MVEALVVIPFFVIIFILTIFLGRIYNEKLRVNRETKKCVWETAMVGNCEGGCGLSQVRDLGDADLDMGSEVNPSQGHPQPDDWLTRTFKENDYQLWGSATASEAMDAGGFTATVNTRQVVMCNEKPEDGKFRSIFLFTYHKLTGF
jgi:hypothetical protein